MIAGGLAGSHETVMNRHDTARVKTVLSLLISTSVLLGGCVSAPAPEYSWYHPQGGEYLFEFDASECEAELRSQGLTLGTDTNGPFFRCMETRGYLLVTERLRTVASSPIGESDITLNNR